MVQVEADAVDVIRPIRCGGSSGVENLQRAPSCDAHNRQRGSLHVGSHPAHVRGFEWCSEVGSNERFPSKTYHVQQSGSIEALK